jgi:hypothetical protein
VRGANAIGPMQKPRSVGNKKPHDPSAGMDPPD